MMPLLVDLVGLLADSGAGSARFLGNLMCRVLDHKHAVHTDALDSKTPAEWIRNHRRMGLWNYLYRY